MKAIDLYKFIEENSIEYHWHDGDVILMPSIYDIQEFNKLLSGSIYDDSGVECTMKDGYFCFYMQNICDYFEIEIKDIFKPE